MLAGLVTVVLISHGGGVPSDNVANPLRVVLQELTLLELLALEASGGNGGNPVLILVMAASGAGFTGNGQGAQVILLMAGNIRSSMEELVEMVTIRWCRWRLWWRRERTHGGGWGGVRRRRLFRWRRRIYKFPVRRWWRRFLQFDGSNQYNVGGYNSGHGLVVITFVEPTNLAPTDLSLSSASIAENSSVGVTVGSFSATDPDDNGSSVYSHSLVAGNGSTDNASFTLEANGTLKTAEVFRLRDQGLLCCPGFRGRRVQRHLRGGLHDFRDRRRRHRSRDHPARQRHRDSRGCRRLFGCGRHLDGRSGRQRHGRSFPVR